MEPGSVGRVYFRRRQEILTYAYENSPFYRRFYSEAGLEPGDIKTEADWVKVPCLTKDLVREHAEEMVVESQRKYIRMNNTCGILTLMKIKHLVDIGGSESESL